MMNYKPDAELASASVEYIMRDVWGGWFVVHRQQDADELLVTTFHDALLGLAERLSFA